MNHEYRETTMNHDVYEKKVSDVMSRDVVTIDAGDSVHEALQLMAEDKVPALPVVDRRGRCICILSSSDLVEVTRDVDASLSPMEETDQPYWGAYMAQLGEHVGHQKVMDLMSESVVSTSADAPLSKAAASMLREKVHRLPVVDGEDWLQGIVSMSDIMGAFVECAPAKKA